MLCASLVCTLDDHDGTAVLYANDCMQLQHSMQLASQSELSVKLCYVAQLYLSSASEPVVTADPIMLLKSCLLPPMLILPVASLQVPMCYKTSSVAVGGT